MTHLDTLRAIHQLAATRSVFSKVDADLSEEAGMDGNYGRMLQAARYLDRDAQVQHTREDSRTLIDAATGYAHARSTVLNLIEVSRKLAEQGNPYADSARQALEQALHCFAPVERALEDVPTWSDINDRAEGK